MRRAKGIFAYIQNGKRSKSTKSNSRPAYGSRVRGKSDSKLNKNYAKNI